MTYHVDLLLDDERRSASSINVGMVLRLSAFVVVAVILLLTMMLFLKSHGVELRKEDAQSQWTHLSPQYDELMALLDTRKELRASSRQIEACRKSRLAVGPELAQLQRGIPDDIQLTSMRMNQFVGNQKAGASATRSYEMRLAGKVAGDDPKANVDELIKYLSSAAYTGRVESVTVPPNSFRKETVRSGVGEARSTWYFELVCRYRPRSFE